MGMISTILLLVMSILASIATGLLKDEIAAFIPRWTDRTFKLAIRLLPGQLKERYSEEWLSHINEYPGKLTQLAQACQFVFAGTMLNDLYRRRIKQFACFYAVQIVSASSGLALNIYATDFWPTRNQMYLLAVIILVAAFVVAVPTQLIYLRLHRTVRQARHGKTGTP